MSGYRVPTPVLPSTGGREAFARRLAGWIALRPASFAHTHRQSGSPRRVCERWPRGKLDSKRRWLSRIVGRVALRPLPACPTPEELIRIALAQPFGQLRLRMPSE